MTRLARWLLTALLLVPLSAAAQATSPSFYPDPFCTPKDFALVKRDGLYHVFYTRHRQGVAFSDNETELGHASSPDFLNWTRLAPVLPVQPGTWEGAHIWAPTIVHQDGVYYMFYTGVSSDDEHPLVQRIGLATSTDLVTWTRHGPPVLSPVDVPWAFCDSTSDLAACRDPFVMADPARPGHWLMYYSTCPRGDSLRMVVGVAESPDLLSWTDRGALWATHASAGGDSTTESPHLFAHDGTWYLFYTAYAATPLRWLTGTDPVGGPATWTYHGDVTPLFPGDPWIYANYASEQFSDGLADYFAYVSAGTIEFRRIAWDGAGAFTLGPPEARHVVSMSWDRAAAAEHDSVRITWVTANPDGASLPLEAVRLRADGTEAAVALADLGLPASVAPVEDTTRLAWRARWVADPQDTAQTLRLVLRLAERTASTAPLEVTAQPPLEVQSLDWDVDTLAYDGRATLAVAARHTVTRTLRLETALVFDSGTVPVTPHAVGLPDTLALSGDTTRVSWDARWYASAADTARTDPLSPDSSFLARPCRLAVRAVESGTVAPALTVMPPGAMTLLALDWDADTVAGDGEATLRIAARHGCGRSITLSANRLVGPRKVPVVMDTLGLPSTVTLIGDTTLVPWEARWLPDPADTLRPMVLYVLTTRKGPAAPALVVLRPEALAVTALAWDRDSVPHGGAATLSVAARHWKRHAVTLQAWRAVGEDWRSVPVDSLGLPARLTLTGDVTSLDWSACWLPAPPDTTSPLRLVVGLAEAQARSAELRVLAPRFEVLRLWWDSTSVRVGHVATLTLVSRDWQRRAARITAWVEDSRGVTPVPPAALGLPEELAPTADTTRFSWTAALPSGCPDTSGTVRLLLRIEEPSLLTTTLAVLGPGARPAAVGGATVPDEGLRTAREGDGWALLVSLRDPRDARLDLYDAQGRRVRRLLAGPLPAGVTRLRWDGRGDDGGVAPPGLYFARLTAAHLRTTIRLVRLR
jgi:beta-fructofuranosidase